jgi:hypothetical protein
MLKDLKHYLIEVQGRLKILEVCVRDLYSSVLLLTDRVKVLEDKTGTYNMLSDKGNSKYKKF